MKHINIVILKACLCLLAGILCEGYLTLPLSFWIGSVVICLFLLTGIQTISLKIPSSKKAFGLLVAISFFSIGILTSHFNDPLRDTSHYRNNTAQESKSTLIFSVQEKLKPTTYQDKYIVNLHYQNGNVASGKILLNISKDSINQPLETGQWYHSYTHIDSLPRPRSPYQFNYGNYLEKIGVHGQVSLDYNELLKSEHRNQNIMLGVERFRESVQKSLRSYPFTQDQLGIISALLLGQRQYINREMSDDYAAAGMIHILAVSGLHVGIIMLLLQGLLSPIFSYRTRRTKSILVVGGIWAFALFTGASPSVLRAATMFTFYEVGRSMGRDAKGYNSLIYSAFFLLLIHPKLIYQVGFQLSYLAVFFILWLQPKIYSWYHPRYYLDKKVWEVFSVTTAAQLGVFPLSLYYFHQFPGLFLISNLVVIPFLGLLLALGIIVVLLARVSWLPESFALAYGQLIDLLNSFIHWIAQQEAFVLKNISLSILGVFALYVCIITIGRLVTSYSYRRVISMGLSLLLAMAVFGYNTYKRSDSHFVIFQQSRGTLLGQLHQNELKIFTSDTGYNSSTDYKIKAYRDALRIDTLQVQSMRNIFRFKQKNILLLDSLGIYKISDFEPNVIVLTQSPDVNLNRLIDLFPKATIVADGSNYRTDVERWKATCRKRKIPFHSTYEKGAYIIE